MLNRIRIVLINTSHPGNIGSTARAMKTMGLSDLYLMNPKEFPSGKAKAMAAGADDIMENAHVIDNLQDALKGCTLVMGTSARERTIPWPVVSPREAAEQLVTESQRHPVALLFGQERFGLTNEQLQQCHSHITIAANPEYSSLNLASAVQVLCYELRMAFLALTEEEPLINNEIKDDLAPAEEYERLMIHFEKVLSDLKFLNPKAPRQLLPRIQRFFLRARTEQMEMNIFRGILSAIERAIE